MEALFRAIREDYQRGRTIDTLRSPDPAAVKRLAEGLLEIIFPKNPPLADIFCRLSALTGHPAALEFFRSIPDIRALVQGDVDAAFAGDPAATGPEEIIACYPGIHAIAVYRIAHALYRLGVPLIPRMMTELAHSRTGIDIHPGAQIGNAFFIDHGTGIVIGQTTVIGENVKLYQGVTLGGLSTRGGQNLRDKKRHPTLEDGVTVYANATILGGDTVIGAGSTIGANAFITSSVPPGSTVKA